MKKQKLALLEKNCYQVMYDMYAYDEYSSCSYPEETFTLSTSKVNEIKVGIVENSVQRFQHMHTFSFFESTRSMCWGGLH